MNSQQLWLSIYNDVFRMKMKRKQIERFVSKIEECGDQNIESLHMDLIQQWVLLYNTYLPHIRACEIWLCDYVVKLRSQCEINPNIFPYIETQKWIHEYVETCLESFHCDFEDNPY